MEPADSIFSSCLPLFSDAEWNWLGNESSQKGIQVSDLHPLGPDQPGGNGNQISGHIPQEPDHPGENVGQFRIQAVGPDHENESSQNGIRVSDLHPLGPDHEVETEAGGDGVEVFGLDPPVPDQPGGNGDQISGQIPQEPDHPGENEVGQFRIQAVGPDHENESSQNGIRVSDLHPLGPDHEVETEAGGDGVEVSRLDPPVPDQLGGNGDQISGQIPQEPDHPGENEVGQFRTQAVGTNLLGPKYPGKDGEGENFPRSSEHAPPVLLAPEASSNLRKRRGRPPKRLELAPVVPVPPRRGRGRPRKDAAANPQNLPRQQSTQHSRRPKETRGLPEGWTTEVKVRERGNSAGHKDKTYIEISTKKRCRSIPDVWRYIEKKRKLE